MSGYFHFKNNPIKIEKALFLSIQLFAIFSVFESHAQSHSKAYDQGVLAFENGDLVRYQELMKASFRCNPEHDLIAFEYMRALTLNQRFKMAQRVLKRLIDKRSVTVYRLYEKVDFDPIITEKLRDQITSIEGIQINSDTANVIDEKDLILEGIAIDERTGRKFIGSIYKEKIAVIETSGEYRDFSHPGDSLWGMLGMEVDESTNSLWAVTAYLPSKKTSKNSGCSRLLQLDLSNGRVLRSYKVCNDLLNDLTIASNGDVYVTATLSARVFKLDRKMETFEPVYDFASKGYRYLNGISVNHQTGQIYVSHETGVLIINAASKAVRELKKSQKISLIGIDGLAYYKNSLIAHQRILNSVTRYLLNKSGTRIVGTEIVDANHPAFDSPTTGELGGDGYYYYIANS